MCVHVDVMKLRVLQHLQGFLPALALLKGAEQGRPAERVKFSSRLPELILGWGAQPYKHCVWACVGVSACFVSCRHMAGFAGTRFCTTTLATSLKEQNCAGPRVFHFAGTYSCAVRDGVALVPNDIAPYGARLMLRAEGLSMESSRIRPSWCNAQSHCDAFSHALITALQDTVSI